MSRTSTWRILTLVTALALLTGGLVTKPAVAGGDAGKILAGLAVGALVYMALDDDCDRPTYCPPRHHRVKQVYYVPRQPVYVSPCPPPRPVHYVPRHQGPRGGYRDYWDDRRDYRGGRGRR